jgi:dTDP-4-amino-4,6-dideoxygalactose transaminase
MQLQQQPRAIPLRVKAHAVYHAAKLAVARITTKNPNKARVVAWWFLSATNHVKSVSHAKAKKTIHAHGTWMCIHRFPIAGEQLFVHTTKANGKPPVKPGPVTEEALAECMLPPQANEWNIRFAGPLGEWEAGIAPAIRARLEAFEPLLRTDDDWLKIDAQL